MSFRGDLADALQRRTFTGDHKMHTAIMLALFFALLALTAFFNLAEVNPITRTLLQLQLLIAP
jgi:hypothetical protein